MAEVLTLVPLPPPALAAVAARYVVIEATDPATRAAVFACADLLATVQAVITNAAIGLSAEQIERLPTLRLVSVVGVGTEAVDHAAARRRGVAVTDGRGTLEDGVADHALALLLALVRDIPAYDRALRTGAPRPPGPPDSVGGKRLGVLGLGEIGLRIARRANAFGMSVAYHNRNRRLDVNYVYHETVEALAEASDILMVAAPGGAQTHHLVDSRVLAALGPRSRLVNIGHGGVVDTRALVDALESGALAGAALDVFEGGPHPVEWLAAAPNLILTPHQAASSPERIAAMTRRLLDSLDAHVRRAPEFHGV